MKKYNPITLSHEKIHKAKTIPVKVAKVDVGVIPVVMWLNDYESVMTVGCCEGDKTINIPQVAFICSDSIILLAILRDIYDFNKARPVVSENGELVRKGVINTDIQYMPNMLNPVVYQMVFGDQDVLKEFIKWKRL